MSKIAIDVSQAELIRVKGWLRNTLRRLITEVGTASYDAGSISGVVADLEAMEQLEPLKANEPPKEPLASPEQVLEERGQAAERHKRNEERASRGR